MTERDVFWQPASSDPETGEWHRAAGIPPFRIDGLSNGTQYRVKDGSGTTFVVTPGTIDGAEENG
jgi:hypothetical protein